MIQLKADNRAVTSGGKYSFLSENYDAGTIEHRVRNPAGYVEGSIVLLGEIGSENAELRIVDYLTDDVLTYTEATSFPHPESTRVTVIQYNEVGFYWTPTASFEPSTPLSGYVPLQVDDWFTRYGDTIHSTGFGWFKFRNSVLGGVTGESNPIPYTNFKRSQVKNLFDGVLSKIRDNERKVIKSDDLVAWLNEARDRLKLKLSMATSEPDASDGTTEISVLAGQAEYDLEDDFSAMISVWVPGTNADGSGGTVLPSMNVSDVDKNNAWPNWVNGIYPSWYVRGTKLGFTPTPASNFIVRYRYDQLPEDISGYYDSVGIPKKMYPAVKDYMLGCCYEKAQDFNKAKWYYDKFDAGVKDLQLTAVNNDGANESWDIAPWANV